MNHSEFLQGTLMRASEGLAKIKDAAASVKSAPDRWSTKEIMGHLIDSAYNNHQRFLRAEKQENLIFQGYDQVDWVLKNNYQGRSFAEIVQTWKTVNLHLVVLIKSLPAHVLKRRTSEHSFERICMNRLEAGEETSLAYLVWDYLFHLEHHLGQILPGFEKKLPAFSH